MEPPQKKNSRRSPLRLIGTLLALGLLVYLLSQQGWQDIFGAIRQIPPWRFALGLLLMFSSRMSIAGRWYVLLRTAGVKISRSQTIRLTFAGLFAANFLPTTVGGDVVRLAGALQLGSARAVYAASIVVDRLIGMAGMATAFPLGAGHLWYWLSIGAPASVETALRSASFANLALSKWHKMLWEKATRTLRKLLTATSIWLGKPASLAGSFGLTWLHMLSKFGAIWVLYGGLGESIPLWLIAGLWSFTYFVTLFPVSINGLGIQEISMAFIFSNIGGVSLNHALTVAVLIRTLEMSASLPGALFLSQFVSPQEENTDEGA